MRYKIFVLISILSFTILIGACGGEQPTTNSAANNKPANAANTAANSSGNALATTKTPEAATSNNAPTLAPVVQAYYDALKKKDDAALRKVLAQESARALEADMKAEKQTSLAAFVAELEISASDAPFETRNERIEGDRAFAEVRGGSYGVWTPFEFVRENGEWKWTGKSADVDSMKKTAAPVNSAK
jgi:hypothetical protein